MLRCVAPFFVCGTMAGTGRVKSGGPACSEGQEQWVRRSSRWVTRVVVYFGIAGRGDAVVRRR